jgi:hypothetical protein
VFTSFLLSGAQHVDALLGWSAAAQAAAEALSPAAAAAAPPAAAVLPGVLLLVLSERAWLNARLEVEGVAGGAMGCARGGGWLMGGWLGPGGALWGCDDAQLLSAVDDCLRGSG